MSHPESKKKSGINWISWSVRIVVFTVLGVLAYLAFADRGRSADAAATAKAWTKQLKEKTDIDSKLQLDDLTELTEGDPSVADGKDPPKDDERYQYARTNEKLGVKIYTWDNLIMADKEIHVTYVKGTNIVVVVEKQQ